MIKNNSYWVSKSNDEMIIVHHTNTPNLFHVFDISNPTHSWILSKDKLLADYSVDSVLL